MKFNLHVVGQDDLNAAAVASEGLNAFTLGIDPLEELLSEFAGLDAELEQQIIEEEEAREREIAVALEAELAAIRARENEFIPKQTKMERVLDSLRELENSLKYLSYLTNEIDHHGP